MISIISILLILAILIFLFTFKRRSIVKVFNSKKNKLNNNNNKIATSQNTIYPSNFQYNLSINKDPQFLSRDEKLFLKRRMNDLFKGSKEDKLKALTIAKKLSDKSTLNILKLGLKDMDADIVEISAGLIENFK
tara:strand:+ start:212 stop:613 length:402 start_codon:yes stop_codon:yes gene_type:complete